MQFFSTIKALVPQQITGLSVHLSADGNVVVCLLNLTFHKGECTIGEPFVFQSLEEAFKSLNGRHPVYCNISGKGILHKFSQEPSENAFSLLFPQADARDFAIQELTLPDGGLLISLMRNTILETIEKQIIEARTPVFAITLGNVVLCGLANLVEGGPVETLVGSGQRLNFEGGHLVEIVAIPSGSQFLSEDLEIDGNVLNVHAQLAMASALQSIQPVSGLKAVESETIHDTRQQFVVKKQFRLIGLSMLATLLCLLTINSFLFMNFNNRVANLEAQLGQSSSQAKDLEQLSKEIALKSVFSKKNGLQASHNLSFYGDRIASVIPASVQLDEMTIFPAQSTSKKEELQSFDFNTIELAGTVGKNTEINEFIDRLKAFDWLMTVSVVHFEKVEKTGLNKFIISAKLIQHGKA